MTDERLQYPATSRNRDVILEVLRGILPTAGLVLEIASGSGEHIVHFAHTFPGLIFQPSDPEEAARKSIAAWAKDRGLDNVRSPLFLDASSPDWPVQSADAILCRSQLLRIGLHLESLIHSAAQQSSGRQLHGLAELLVKLLGPRRQRQALETRRFAARQALNVVDDGADPLRVGADDLGEPTIVARLIR